MKTSLLLATLIALPLGLALAADPAAPKPKRDPAQIFKGIDHDGDGSISLEEFKASTVGQIDRSRVESVFKKKDADGDGKLTLTEYMFIPPKEAPKPAPAKEGEKAKKEKSE